MGIQEIERMLGSLKLLPAVLNQDKIAGFVGLAKGSGSFPH